METSHNNPRFLMTPNIELNIIDVGGNPIDEGKNHRRHREIQVGELAMRNVLVVLLVMTPG